VDSNDDGDEFIMDKKNTLYMELLLFKWDTCEEGDTVHNRSAEGFTITASYMHCDIFVFFL
jgi:hypothetical protein